MCGLGLTQLEIANLVGISDRTLRTYYRVELNNGVAAATLRVSQALFTNATKHNNVAAQIWWLKVRGGPAWREQDPNTATGANHFVFSWKDDPQPPPASNSVRAPPTIEAEPEAGDANTGTELVVQWAGED